jgi:hypothetical protein
MYRRQIAAAVVALSLAPWMSARAYAQSETPSVQPRPLTELAFTSAVADVASKAAVQPDATTTLPRPVDLFGHTSSHGTALLRSLYASTAVLQALDVRSTLSAFSHGAVEGNALMTGITAHTPVFVATKAAVATSMILAAHQMARHNRFAAVATLIGLNSAYALVVSHNFHLAAAR